MRLWVCQMDMRVTELTPSCGKGGMNDSNRPEQARTSNGTPSTDDSSVVSETEKWIKQKMKAAVPDRKEKPVMGLVSDKDYVCTNAVKAILSKPPKAAPPKRWTQRKGYGETPSFCIAAAAASQENASQDSTQARVFRLAVRLQSLCHVQRSKDGHNLQMKSVEMCSDI